MTRFELGKLDAAAVRERMVGMLGHIDRTLAEQVAAGLGLPAVPRVEPPLNLSVPADGNPKDFEPRRPKKTLEASAALSMARTIKDTAKSRKVAILAADGVDSAAVDAMKKALTAAGATGEDAMAVLFVTEAYKHCKAIAATGAGVALLPPAAKPNGAPTKAGPLEEGVIARGDGDVAKVAADFIKAIASHRAWSRGAKGQRIPV